MNPKDHHVPVIRPLTSVLLPALLFLLAPSAALHAQASARLDDQFRNPPQSARPWVYWMWLTVNTSPEAITADLEEMKAKGIAGFILYDSGAGGMADVNAKMVVRGKEYQKVPTDDFKGAYATPIPTGPLPAWSPRWRDLMRFVAKESKRLGLQFCLSNGLAGTSGHISPEYGQQKLIWVESPVVSGPMRYDGFLPLADKPAKRGAPATPVHENVALLAVPAKDGFSPSMVIDLSAKIDAKGHFHWDVPPGSWKVIRFAQVPTMMKNTWGLFTDGMSAEAMDKTWEATMGPLLNEMTPEERQGLIGIEDDSWEAGKTTWTKTFAAEFQQRRGYDLRPWLPLLAGEKMGDPTTAARVVRDYNLTISDMIADNHYAHLQKLAHDNGLIFYSEAAGPNLYQSDLLKNSSKVDMAMAEFWMPSAHRPTPPLRFHLRVAASTNHLYGKPLTMCESFTSLGPHWEESLFSIKATADQAFCDGLNQVCIHVYSHSPSVTAKPGYVYFAGTRYDRNVTWWEQTPAFNLYLARCSQMLRQGKFVADAVIYHGDNLGQQEQRKAVYPTLGEGYDHDGCNSEVILTRMSVKGGRIEVLGGMSYRVLVLPEPLPVQLDVLEKIAAMTEAGATIVGPRPIGMAGLPLHRDDVAKFNALVARLWAGADGGGATENHMGKGRVVWGRTAREVLQKDGVPTDFAQSGLSDKGVMDWIHYRTDTADMYYVTSRWEPEEKVTCSFRVSGRQPELWDPVTGAIRDAMAFHQENGQTVVPLEFGPCGSTFVVFRRPINLNAAGTETSNYPRVKRAAAITGTWNVSFDPKWGGPAFVTFDKLTDWTKRPEEGIKYYSGTAVYRKKFDLETTPVQGKRLLLDLGEVREECSVRLNGRDLGVIWSKPARVDITNCVSKTGNELELKVVNLWPNRLIGDAGLPKEKQFTETNMHKFNHNSPLLPSGLLGPVNVLTEE